jgi:hypothetical protein
MQTLLVFAVTAVTSVHTAEIRYFRGYGVPKQLRTFRTLGRAWRVAVTSAGGSTPPLCSSDQHSTGNLNANRYAARRTPRGAVPGRRESAGGENASAARCANARPAGAIPLLR